MQAAAARKVHVNEFAEQEDGDGEGGGGGGVCGFYKWWRVLLLSLVLLSLAEWYELLDAKVGTNALLGVDPLSLRSNISNSSSTRFEAQNRSDDSSHTSPPPPPLPPPPDNTLLLEALSQTLSLVTNGKGESMNETQRKEWDRRNPCSSRWELPLMYLDRNHSKELLRSPEWEQVLEKYSELHRACMRRVGTVRDYFLNRNDSVPGCKFVVADANPGAGLGNKILVLVSAFAYALVTQRILLVSHLSLLPANTCEPFIGSSWFLNSSQLLLTRSHGHSWQTDDQFYGQIDAHVRYWGKQNASSQLRAGAAQVVESKYQNPNASFPWRPEDYAVVASPDSAHSYQAHSRFYCRAEQEYYSQVPFVLWSGCIYTIPRLFTTITFLPAFEQMFPDRMILTRILRGVVLPNNAVWRRIKHLAHAYLMRKDGSRRVGIQMRFRIGADENLVNRRVLDCLWKENILPNVTQSLPIDNDDQQKQQQQQSLSAIKTAPVIKVFIASLLHGLYDHITKAYLENPVTVTGEDVSLVQLTSSRKQRWNSIEEDTEAFTEILLLSFSDQLLVTPISTFGGIAQAYGALIPWFIEFRPELENRTTPPCQRGETIDVAQQISSVYLNCNLDEISKGNITVKAPYLRPVLDIELSGRYSGIHLMTDF